MKDYRGCIWTLKFNPMLPINSIADFLTNCDGFYIKAGLVRRDNSDCIYNNIDFKCMIFAGQEVCIVDTFDDPIEPNFRFDEFRNDVRTVLEQGSVWVFKNTVIYYSNENHLKRIKSKMCDTTDATI